MNVSLIHIPENKTPMMYNNFVDKLEAVLQQSGNVFDVKIFETPDHLFKGFIIVER